MKVISIKVKLEVIKEQNNIVKLVVIQILKIVVIKFLRKGKFMLVKIV